MIFELVSASICISQFVTLTLVALTLAIALTVAYFWWGLLRQVAFDCVAIYGSAITAKRDDDQRRAKLEMWQLQSRAAIRDRRAMLQAGSAAMWESGAYDIEVDE